MTRWFPLLLLSLASATEPPAPLAEWVRQDKLDPPEPGAVVFIGSSSIRRWESLQRDFAGYRILRRGWGGSWLSEMDEAAPFVVFPYQPSALVMWAGTNDLSGGKSGEEVHADFIAFHNALRKQLPEMPFLFLGFTRTPANGPTTVARNTANRLIRQTIAEDAHATFVDLPSYFAGLSAEGLDALYVDPVHLNHDGYAQWTRMIRPALEAVVRPNEAPANPSLAPKSGTRLLFDFGPDNGNEDGASPSSPDLRGHHWNHWYPVPGDARIIPGEHLSGIVDAEGQATGMRLTITGGFRTNGRRHGGLLDPSHEALGDLAIEEATEDFFFSTADNRKGGGDDDLGGSFMLTGLDPDLPCELRFLGSRADPELRVTEYTVFGEKSATVTLATSANTSELAIVSGMKPDRFGRLFIDLTAKKGSFAYLNALEIRVGEIR